MKILQLCNGLVNAGDILASLLTERLFGLEVVKVFKTMATEHHNMPVLAGLGSFLAYYGDWPMHVWGTGYEPGYADREARANPGSRKNWRFYAVRGHLTRVAMKLDARIPVGDPALLTPRVYSPRSSPYAAVRYVLHCDNYEPPPLPEGVEVCSAGQEPFPLIDRIAASGFAFTEALHGAILAHAYGVPWAWCLNKHHRGIVKWYDWFSSIGVAGRCFAPSELVDARRWYEGARKDFVTVDLDRLLRAFPGHIAFQRRE